MSSSKKRPSDFIDLTAENHDAPRHKHARVHHNHPPNSGSSQPPASQSLSSSTSSIHLTPSHLTNRDQWSTSSSSNNINEEDEIIDLSQDIDEGVEWTVLGSLDGKIVGIQYYVGYATPGEQVMVKREPGNPYDSNAIRVNNVQGTQIGHLPRVLASKLAPYLDSRIIVIEAVLAGEKGRYDCPVLLKIFGPVEPRLRAELESKLKNDRIVLRKQRATAQQIPSQATHSPPVGRGKFTNSQSSHGMPGSSQPEEPTLSQFIEVSERFRPRDVEKLVDEWGVGEESMARMPMADQPTKLKSILLPYQRQGLAWMLEKENPKLPAVGSQEVVQLWKRSADRSNVFQNLATAYSTATAPTLLKGGILADDMGLGKTLQVISCILEGIAGTTLIIAPMSVMSNWSQQMERHIKAEHALKVFTYHGNNKKPMTHNDFAEYDVVITTYGTLSEEYKPRNAKEPAKIPRSHGLFSMNWARVVLDEGHTIRNYATKGARAASSLLATSRWVLTGTPIVNTIKDLYSMLKFLRITGGLEQIEMFNAVLTRKLASGDPHAERVLQSIMKTLSLRRRKDMKFVDLKLPEISEYVHRVTFRQDERKKYDAFVSEAQGMLKKFQAGTGAKGINAYRHLLEVLLRMRQTCCHWKICGEARVNDLLAILENDEVVSLTAENKAALQVLLQLSIDSQEECSICLDDLHNPVITACKHVFGGECIEKTIELQHKCPMCRNPLADKEVLVHPAKEEKEETLDINTQSSKTEALMSILAASRKDPLSKVVIFSQWTSFLNIIQHQLDEAGMKYTRIDGTMTTGARDAAMTALETDPDTRILLASLAVCSVGLNLVAADTVIMADSWWAPAIEDQAVDRVHRLGQTRPCTVWRLIMEDSIEERVLEIQAEKRKLVGKAFREEAKGGKAKTTRMGDIAKLLA